MSFADDYGQPVVEALKGLGETGATSSPPSNVAPAAPERLLEAIAILERGIERHNVRSSQADELLNEALELLKGMRP